MNETNLILSLIKLLDDYNNPGNAINNNIFQRITFFVSFWPCCMACGILVPQPGIQCRPLAMRAWNPNHWTAREFLGSCLLRCDLHKINCTHCKCVHPCSHHNSKTQNIPLLPKFLLCSFAVKPLLIPGARQILSLLVLYFCRCSVFQNFICIQTYSM